MGQHSIDEVQEFHKFIENLLVNKRFELTPEQALDLWRKKYPLNEGETFEAAATGDDADTATIH